MPRLLLSQRFGIKKKTAKKAVWFEAVISRALFSRDGFLIVQCGMHGVPRESGALYSNWKLPHACEDSQIAEAPRLRLFIGVVAIVIINIAGHHSMKLIEELLGLLLALSFDGLSHHAGCSFRDGAA